MSGFILLTVAATAVSWAADTGKTRRGLRQGWRMLIRLLPALTGVLAGVSLALAAIPAESLRALLARDSPLTFLAALAVGSVTLMPGFVAYPLAAGLKAGGASVSVLAAFLTTLMMVGVATLPVEARFFGWRIALWRNALAFIGAAVVAAGMAVLLR